MTTESDEYKEWIACDVLGCSIEWLKRFGAIIALGMHNFISCTLSCGYGIGFWAILDPFIPRLLRNNPFI
jgi:hypothetical protein